MKNTCRLLTPKSAYTVDYPQAVEFANTQNDIHWTHKHIHMEKELQDVLVNLTEAERHGVVTVLKLFTHYELFAGNEYWGGRIMKKFPRPADIQVMANCFSYFELNVHAPFYNKINELLNLNTDEFYDSYTKDETLKERMEFIDKAISSKDIALSLGVFSLVEGAILYSSFAFLKHFQEGGKNKLLNLVRGINYSVNDENLHCEGGSWLFRQYIEEMEYEQYEWDMLCQDIRSAAIDLYDHECRIVDMIFEKGSIENIDSYNLKQFVKSRINHCLGLLNIEPIYNNTENNISKWFYKNINAVKLNDQFSGKGNSYNSAWDETKFAWSGQRTIEW